MSNANIMKNKRFCLWFGDSKVVDERGDPLVVYHGTAEIFNVFDTHSDEDGAFFTSNESGAAQYGPRVVRVYLSLQNPKILTEEEWASGDAMTREEAEEAGYDGFIIRNHDVRTAWGVGEDFSGDTFIAFRPEQIKSATENNGAFNPKNPNFCDNTDEFERSPHHWWQIPDDGLSL